MNNRTNKTDNKYHGIFKELKSEKMNWDFEDFLKETEKEEKPFLVISEKKSASFPKFYSMAASLVLLASLGIFFTFFNKKSISKQDELVKNEILKQKNDLNSGNEIVAIHTEDSIKTVRDSLFEDSVSVSRDEEVMDKILPKRGRLKKQIPQRYVKQLTPKKSEKIEYESNYVIINGQKIENEKEAIDLTKYSFRILSENISKTMAQTEAIPNFINE